LVSAVGAVLSLAGVFGWFREVLPRESCEVVHVVPEEAVASTTRREVAQLETARQVRRAWLPVQIYPVSAGIKGGLAGGAVMALLAILYGVISRYGVWYPINLLSAGFFPGAKAESAADLARFQPAAFVIAFVIHLAGSLLVGVLYGALLPMLPRHPVVLGGLFAPLVWSGLLHSIIGIVNPVLNQHVDWPWFVLSQIGFGVVAGIVVSRQARIDVWQKLPLVLRAGIEASGLAHENGKGEKG
ncbi:MAG TPA: hypothetical protein VN177_07950, partial [Myxococcales bacterium]|nr:hypothetical protein [Myxococcales bacterium]